MCGPKLPFFVCICVCVYENEYVYVHVCVCLLFFCVLLHINSKEINVNNPTHTQTNIYTLTHSLIHLTAKLSAPSSREGRCKKGHPCLPMRQSHIGREHQANDGDDDDDDEPTTNDNLARTPRVC